MKLIRFILGATFTASTMSAVAQGIIASGDILGTQVGSDYDYTLSISDGGAATSPIGSFWYAWTPGNFYLPSAPTAAFAPSGWSANISSDSIQFIASGSSDYVQPGSTLNGFGFTSANSPTQLAGIDNSANPPAPIGTTVAYGMGLFSSPSDQFVFSTTATPEPSSLMLMGVGAFGMLMRRLKK